MLDILKANQVQATLFITSNYANTPEMISLLKRALSDGHELGNHMPDDRPYNNDNSTFFRNKLMQTKMILEKDLQGCKWFRAPSGLLSP